MSHSGLNMLTAAVAYDAGPSVGWVLMINSTARHAPFWAYSRSQPAGSYPVATRAARNASSGKSYSSFQRTRIGRSPEWLT